jgi:hypothetical protein
MSTSIALVTCADVSSERRMWSAMPRRIALIGSSCSPTCAVTGAAGALGAGAAGAGAAGVAAGAACFAWPPCSMNWRMSFFVTRPLRPLPVTWPGSTPCSAAIRATTGDTKLLPFPLASSSPVVSAAAAGAGFTSSTVSAVGVVPTESLAAFASAAAGAVAGSGISPLPPSDEGATSAPSGAITASFVPTSTVSPSWTRISASTPVAGAGTSVSTLSVEISSSPSSAAIGSPTCLSHFVIVPSETETPICGMTTSVAPATATSSRPAPAVP